MSYTLEELQRIADDDNSEETFVFMGSSWSEDSTVTDGVFPGHRYTGQKLMANCNDLFWWAVGDGEDITEETLPEFNKAIDDCKGDKGLGVWLYCCRMRWIGI